jgi:hypothetical protein
VRQRAAQPLALLLISAGAARRVATVRGLELLRGATYSAMARLAERAPASFRGDLALVESLFAAAAEEPPLIRISLQEVLGALSGAVRRPEPAAAARIHALLLQSVASAVRRGGSGFIQATSVPDACATGAIAAQCCGAVGQVCVSVRRRSGARGVCAGVGRRPQRRA